MLLKKADPLNLSHVLCLLLERYVDVLDLLVGQ